MAVVVVVADVFFSSSLAVYWLACWDRAGVAAVFFLFSSLRAWFVHPEGYLDFVLCFLLQFTRQGARPKCSMSAREVFRIVGQNTPTGVHDDARLEDYGSNGECTPHGAVCAQGRGRPLVCCTSWR